jgi:P27 family predicted phage terminase small subunit
VVEALTDTPEAPQDLGTHGSEMWHKTVSKMMEVEGLLTALDLSALEAYCRSWQAYMDADEYIKRNGLIVWTPQGGKASPAISARSMALSACYRYQQMFGMMPAARKKLPRVPKQTKEEEEQNPIAKIFEMRQRGAAS